jgi:hypothetical protein
MYRGLLSKLLTIGIIVLFIGVGIHPAFAIDTKQSIVNKVNDEECWDCKKIDNLQLLVLEQELNRLEVYAKLLLVLSKHNSEIKNKIEELSNEISSLKTLNPYNEVICGILQLIMGVGAQIGLYLIELYERFKEIVIIKNIIDMLLASLIAIGGSILIFGNLFDCWE